MSTEKMTITRALKELSLLNKRIDSAVREIRPVDVKQNKFKGQALNAKMSIDAFSEKVKNDYRSACALIDRRTKIKRAIALKNATTTVKVGKVEMTVAEAIANKDFLTSKKLLMNHLNSAYMDAKTTVERGRVDLDRQVEQLIVANVGKDKKADKDDYDKIATPFIDANRLELVDPLEAAKTVSDLRADIEDFEANVDIALSEVNATTLIEI